MSSRCRSVPQPLDPAVPAGAGGIRRQPPRPHGLLWVVMITSAQNRGWPGDVPVSHLAAAWLPVLSVIRTAKIATIAAADAAKLGAVALALLRRVADCLARELGLNPTT